MKNTEKAIKLKSDLDTLRPISKEDELRIMQKFRLDWNYHSNHIEGNSLTYGETKALILFGITAQGKPLKDHFEMSGHDEAVKWILDIIKEERPLTENFIRELHKLILKEPYEVDAITPDGNPTKKRIEIGQYKSIPNHVKTKTGEIFRFASPEETPALMKDLLEWHRIETSKESFNPVLIASEFHYKFIRIHPFDDGNGRTARILMNFILLQNGFPPVIIKTDDKINYFGESIVPLTHKFIEKAEKFEKFYIKSKFNILVDNGYRPSNKEKALELARENIKEQTNLIRPGFSYTAFNQKGFQESNYRSSIEFQFDYTRYKVFDSKKQVFFEKSYSEQLDNNEIIQLVNSEIKRHKNQIEKQISEIKKSKE